MDFARRTLSLCLGLLHKQLIAVKLQSRAVAGFRIPLGAAVDPSDGDTATSPQLGMIETHFVEALGDVDEGDSFDDLEVTG